MNMPSNQNEPYVYYAPGEVVFLFEHDRNFRFDESATIQSVFEGVDLGDLGVLLKPGNIQYQRQIRFPSAPSDDGDNRRHFTLFLLTLADALTLIPLVQGFFRLIQRFRQDNQPGLNLDQRSYLRLVTPNWLMGGGPGHGPTGGPGGEPRPASVPGGDETRLGIALPPGFEQRFGGLGEFPIDVAILDTVPPPRRLNTAYIAQGKRPNPALRKLLESESGAKIPLNLPMDSIFETIDDFLTIRYAESLPSGRAVFQAIDDNKYTVKDHNYDLSDHGVFVASIVRALAPRAKLTLVEVLNEHGVGTFRSLVEGFELVLQEHESKPAEHRLIVNCSLMFGLPIDDHISDDLDPELKELLKDQNFEGDLRYLIETLCQVFDINTLIVAAAGNDSQTQDRLRARYPAALDVVIGVGALGSNDNPAPYSNLADVPPVLGITCYGGDLLPQGGGGTGIKGVYTGTFPNGQANSNCYAEWSGTSFATPVITGAVAWLCTQRPNPPNVPYRPRDAFNDVLAWSTARTGVGEEIFEIVR